MALTPDIIANLPRSTGVYLMRSAAGEILYIGKAKDLRNRVHAYLGQDTRPNVPFIAEQTVKVDFIITGNEKEALFLENQLIKTHRPRFNICLLYTSDAADDLLCVDLGGRRIIKKKKNNTIYTL